MFKIESLGHPPFLLYLFHQSVCAALLCCNHLQQIRAMCCVLQGDGGTVINGWCLLQQYAVGVVESYCQNVIAAY